MLKALIPGAALAAVTLLAGCNNDTVTLPHQPITAATKYTQIERLSRPAVKEAFEKFVDHQTSNSTEPYDTTNDPLYAQIKGLEDALRPPKNGADYGAFLQAVLYPDEYAVDLSTSSNGPVGAAGPTDGTYGYFLSYELAHATNSGTAFGGRAPNDNVIDLELGALFGGTLAAVGLQPEDNQENNCISIQNVAQNTTQKTTSTFPYLAAAH